MVQRQMVAAVCEYDCDMYDAATVNRMIGQLRHLLTQIAANPDRKISSSNSEDAGDPLPPLCLATISRFRHRAIFSPALKERPNVGASLSKRFSAACTHTWGNLTSDCYSRIFICKRNSAARHPRCSHA